MTEPDVATGQATPQEIADATADRLLTAAATVLGREADPRADRHVEAARSLQALVERLIETLDPALAWLLLTTVAGAYPRADDVRGLRRAARLAGEREVTFDLLDRALLLATESRTASRRMELVGGVVVDLDSCARSDFHNGIQRVARETVQEWGRHHDVTVVAWTDEAGITRSLTPREQDRATRWGSLQDEIEPVLPSEDGVDEDPHDATAADTTVLVVPWRATVVLAEVPLADRCPALAALAEFSGNEVVAIGYDAIPVVSADLRPHGEANAFAAYLTVIKHSARVAGISSSATVEFAGFAHALSSQGLAGPTVTEVLLPSDVPAAHPEYQRVESARPRVVSVGRTEPHKNHGALLHAAELLWREGLEFDLDLIGAQGWSTEGIGRQLADLERAGRPVRSLGSISDDELWQTIRDASFTVFVSLHEGFGLPVSESLACGTPVVTTRYGSQGEIAEGGGCLTVDPRDDDDLARAMRTMLTDPVTVARLRREAALRAPRTWSEYADELWTALVEAGAS